MWRSLVFFFFFLYTLPVYLLDHFRLTPACPGQQQCRISLWRWRSNFVTICISACTLFFPQYDCCGAENGAIDYASTLTLPSTCRTINAASVCMSVRAVDSWWESGEIDDWLWRNGWVDDWWVFGLLSWWWWWMSVWIDGWVSLGGWVNYWNHCIRLSICPFVRL